MPGLEPGDITLTVSKDGAAVRAEGARGDRKYSKYVRLPFKIDPASVLAFYKQGVLIISARKSVEEEIKSQG